MLLWLSGGASCAPPQYDVRQEWDSTSYPGNFGHHNLLLRLRLFIALVHPLCRRVNGNPSSDHNQKQKDH